MIATGCAVPGGRACSRCKALGAGAVAGSRPLGQLCRVARRPWRGVCCGNLLDLGVPAARNPMIEVVWGAIGQ